MERLLEPLPYLILLFMGVIFARRWLVNPKPDVAKFPRKTRWVSLVLFCWFGLFVAGAISRAIGWHLADGIAYDEGAELPYYVVHDGVGTNVWTLFLGWSLGFICWGIASLLPRKGGSSNP